MRINQWIVPVNLKWYQVILCLAYVLICPVYLWAKNDKMNQRLSKYALKEVKKLEKEGWRTFDGDPSMAEQLEQNYSLQMEYDEDLYPKYILGEGLCSGYTLKEAEVKAEKGARLNLCVTVLMELEVQEEEVVARTLQESIEKDLADKQTYFLYKDLATSDYQPVKIVGFCMGQKVCELRSNVESPDAYRIFTDVADKTYMRLPHIKNAKTALKLFRQVHDYYEVIIRVFTQGRSSFAKIGNLYYYLDEEKNTAEVTYHFDYARLEDVTIPPKVVYNERTYDVVGVYDNAFWDAKRIKTVKCPVRIDMSKIQLPDRAELIAYNPQPPLLVIEDGSLGFVDSTSNNRIDAEERSYIQFKVKNMGKGDAADCTVKVTMSGTTDGISVSSISLPSIAVDQAQEVKIPVYSDIHTQDGKVTFSIEIVEPSGWGVTPFDLIVATKAYEPPYLQVVDYNISSTSGDVHLLEPFTLTFNLQNVQYGDAEDVMVKINLPHKDIYIVNGDTVLMYPMIKAGEKKTIKISLIANNNFKGTYIPITIDPKEKHGKYAENKQLNIELLRTGSAATEITVKEERSKFKIISSQDMALVISGTPRISILTNTSVSIMRPEWYNKYHNPQNIKAPFPYAVIKLDLKGNKETVEIAKQTLSLMLGGKHIVTEKDTKDTNTIWFLVHCRNEYIDLDCGDGCEPINIWKERLEPNKIYCGAVTISVQ